MHKANSFVTLTYSNENLSPGLNYKDFQLFMRRLRKHVPKVRFFAAGEYGEENLRPHWHALLFGATFDDAGPVSDQTRRSKTLEKLWPHGYSSHGPITTATAGYVARYAVKKVTGQNASTWYTRLDPTTGELVECVPEMARMSLRPGIGATWFKKYWREIYETRDGVTQPGGRQQPPPRYYDKKLQEIDDELAELVKANRYNKSFTYAEDNTAARLAVREQCAKAKNAFLKRQL